MNNSMCPKTMKFYFDLMVEKLVVVGCCFSSVYKLHYLG